MISAGTLLLFHGSKLARLLMRERSTVIETLSLFWFCCMCYTSLSPLAAVKTKSNLCRYQFSAGQQAESQPRLSVGSSNRDLSQLLMNLYWELQGERENKTSCWKDAHHLSSRVPSWAWITLSQWLHHALFSERCGQGAAQLQWTLIMTQ